LNSYIIGTSLVCNVADNYHEVIENVKQLTQDGYENHISVLLKEKPFYKINNYDFSNNQRYEKIIQKIVFDAIKDAKLSQEEQEELHIFVGSTSMEMGTNEEHKEAFIKDPSKNEFKEIGNGSIGTYIESLINSKYKAMLFTTACTSSVNALAHASKLIEQKKIKRAIVIGHELFNKSTFGGFSSLMLISKSRVYRPFDKDSDGIILGEACSAVILDGTKKTDTDFKYLGSSNVCDNYSETTSDPSGLPIFNAMQNALNNSKLDLDDIDCIKAHATGSENNNSSEAKAIGLLFEKYQTKTDVTALKPILGHTLGACGTNEIVLMLNAIKHSFLPATFGFKNPAEDLTFQPLLEHTPCSNKATVLFNYVAFGGNNISVILSNKD